MEQRSMLYAKKGGGGTIIAASASKKGKSKIYSAC